MSIIDIITLFGIMIALAALPSASVALVITRSATFGVANGVAVTAGIILGDLVFILLAIFGLSVVAETMGSLFMIVKYLGATYLLWLGYTLIAFKSTTTITVDKTVKKQNLVTSFIAGFILTLGDIKAIIFYASLLPVFVNLSILQASDVLIIISVMVVSLGSVKILYAVSAAKVVTFVTGKKLDNVARKTAGGFMLGAGSYLIVKA
ncbi:threonine transporter [Methyloprofundus sedimenti]|uniref:Threonine transporter n=1 Tax=Methyloprofundus sedimenti TaxID=1420851 RepID=A0A1V8M224_9GAMM|nr:LysE family translocator [Methyloprofundus sedimenti]OQK15558.1 threonine transporter [Methyloprofundus sedimenti]